MFQKVAKKIELLEDFTYYFALFFDKYDDVSKCWQGGYLLTITIL